MNTFSDFIKESSNTAEDNPLHDTLTAHGYKHAGSQRNVEMAEHTYKRKGSSPVKVKFSGGAHSWEHKKTSGFGPTKLNNSLHSHNGTGEHIDEIRD